MAITEVNATSSSSSSETTRIVDLYPRFLGDGRITTSSSVVSSSEMMINVLEGSFLVMALAARAALTRRASSRKLPVSSAESSLSDDAEGRAERGCIWRRGIDPASTFVVEVNGSSGFTLAGAAASFAVGRFACWDRDVCLKLL